MNNKIGDYISNIREETREQVYKKIIDSSLLEEALETKEGKMILKSCIELINTNVLKIVSICSDTDLEEAAAKVYVPAKEINMVYKIMHDWARILEEGNHHRKQIGD